MPRVPMFETHDVTYNSVKLAPLVACWFLKGFWFVFTGTELPEVLGRLRGHILIKLHLYATKVVSWKSVSLSSMTSV